MFDSQTYASHFVATLASFPVHSANNWNCNYMGFRRSIKIENILDIDLFLLNPTIASCIAKNIQDIVHKVCSVSSRKKWLSVHTLAVYKNVVI